MVDVLGFVARVSQHIRGLPIEQLAWMKESHVYTTVYRLRYIILCSILGFLPLPTVWFTLDWMQRMTYYAPNGDKEGTRSPDLPKQVNWQHSGTGSTGELLWVAEELWQGQRMGTGRSCRIWQPNRDKAATAPGSHVRQQQGWACVPSRHVHSPALTSTGVTVRFRAKPGSDPAWRQAQQQDSHWNRPLHLGMHCHCSSRADPGLWLEGPSYFTVSPGLRDCPQHLREHGQVPCEGIAKTRSEH